LLGATNVSTPASLSRHFAWTCAKTPSNSAERAFSCPSASVCYAVGASSGATPWYGKFLAAGAWGAVNTIFKSTTGGTTWFPSNSDMFSIACTNSATCITVGAGGRERMTGDGGDTWTDTPTAPGNNKPLTQIECPSSSICYAVGDRGNAMKSTDGGQSWNWLSSADGNPLYGLSCPTTSVCYATDIYAHVIKTTNGGATWAAQTTPVTTPMSTQVAETGGPNPFAGLTGISCADANTCAAVGFYATVSGQTPVGGNLPFAVTTTDGGNTWTRRQTAATGTSYLAAVKCLPGTTTCFAVGRGGVISTTTDLATWTPMTSGTTNMLNSIYCSSATSCIAVGQAGTVDVYNGTTWTATTGNGGTGMLADVACDGGNLVCYATGKQGITLLTTDGGATWTQKAGGGSQANQLNGISCTSTSTCYAAGAAGQMLKTTNGGQTWTIPTSGTTAALNAISCFQANSCVAVGAVASGAATVRFTNNGTNWNTGLNTGTQALNGVSCVPNQAACLAVGAAGSAITTTAGGGSWDPTPTGTTNALNAVSCPASTACYAVGAGGTILKFPNVSSGPTALTSGTTTTLNGVACSNASACIADGNSLIIGTTNGSSFSVQGNPLGGPSTAQNASALALNGALCTSSRCFVGAGAQGDILTAQTLTVTVNASGIQGSAPNLSNIPASSSKISYSPSGEAPNVTGTLTCSTTADSSSPVGNYPVSSCSGLSDDGFNVVYDYANSNYAVVGITTTATLTPAAVNGWNFNPTTVTLTAAGQNTTIANTRYRVDSTGAFQLYTGPFQVSGGGTHTVDYFSTDTLGNVEATKTTTFQIDTTPPTTTASVAPPSPNGSNGWYVTSPTVTLSATDAGLGVQSSFYRIDGGATQTYSAPFPLTTDGAHVIQYWSTDIGGNTEPPNAITVKVDLTNPTSSASISPAERNGWYASPTVTLTGADGAGSGIDHISYKIDGEATWHTYTGPLSGFSTGNHFVQFQATDVAGRVEPTVNLIAFKADSVKPSVNITRPDDGQVFPLDKVVTAAFKCVDRESGIDTCVGTVANGANLDTSTVGDHTFTVTATDKSGNVTTVTNHYQVVYTWNGFFAPVTNTDDGLNLVHAGDLIKLGFSLNGDRGLTPFAAGFPDSIAIACPSGTPHSVPAGGAGTTPGLSYGVASGHYTYGWQTSSSWAGTCRRFEIKLNDGTSTLHSADFMFFA
jgi:photosystem II stability/assembly factor-like uncharacterized protein